MRDVSNRIFTRAIEEIQRELPSVTWFEGNESTINETAIHCFLPDEVDLIDAYELAVNSNCKRIYIYKREP